MSVACVLSIVDNSKDNKMNSQIDEFERIMLDYLKGEISSEDMQKLTILLKRENACREKYREIARSYALASSSWFARRKEQKL